MATELQPYQQRVVDEKKELDERISKLQAFISSDKFADVDPAERNRMVRQLEIMNSYSGILGQRIAAFA